MIKRLKHFYKRKFWSPEKYARYTGVKIGKNCDIQKVSFGSEPYLVEIGNHVQITSGTKIFTHGGGWVFRDQYPKLDYFGKVKIKNNVYIGNNSMIMPGVTIGNDVIVGAGSIVTKSIPDGKIVAGNPARIVGETSEFVEKIKQYDVGSKGMSYEEKRKLLLKLENERFIAK
ncbi:capsule biosynthesis protein CapG [Brumimicrobium salinarum]|uniref:Capsule biosynthesis protein CapG n=1 Tax=Brumimicrobium salinarum TaxID=2058658 RepID=A0A2I0R048_9FLAO|nr:acyltransferase [Brumimicrobium salinarum]PKR79943.1 capsule biosynthesis protein CapG [Brumimicrobium salinarum]